MNEPTESRRRIIGLKSLVHDAVDATVGLVLDGHESASRGIHAAGEVVGVGESVRTIERVRMGATRGVLHTVSAVNRTVEAVTDAAFNLVSPDPAIASMPAVPLTDEIRFKRGWWSDTLVGGVNGAVGDHLVRRGNPLGAEMVLRIGDRYYRPSRCAPNEFDDLRHIAVFVHGLAATEWSWVFGAMQSWGDPSTHFATLLRDEFGITPVYIRYNTGRTVAENGADLALLLERLRHRAPNLQTIDLFGHSMGGLVVREACRRGTERNVGWTALAHSLFYLGSPHTGAPLARIARGVAGVLGAVDSPATQVIANIIDGRSEGIKDLADGLSAALPLPEARHTFISGTVTRAPDNPVGWVLGDLLVRRPSAEGEGLTNRIVPVSRQHRGNVVHHEMQNHPAVFELIRDHYERQHPRIESTQA